MSWVPSGCFVPTAEEEEEEEGGGNTENRKERKQPPELPPPPARRRDALRPFSGSAGGCSPPNPPIRLPTLSFLCSRVGFVLLLLLLLLLCCEAAQALFSNGGAPSLPGLGAAGGGGCWQRAASAVAFLSPFLSLLYSPPSLFLLSLVPFSTLFPAGVCHRFGAGVKSWLVKGECLPASGVQQKRYCRAQGSGRGKNKLLAKSPGAEPWEEESGPSLHRCHRAARPMRL